MSVPTIVRTRVELDGVVDGWRARGETSALVPTMGALHAGHLALVGRARAEARRTIVSIFVNPTQFAASEDLATYPRTFEADVALLAARDVDVVYAPAPGDMYPDGFSSRVGVGGPALAGLEDRSRPHFFGGVATVVAKLFNRCRAEVALFGEKDYQQLLVVRRLAADLDFAVRVVGVPTVRDIDGLALSSRNRNLAPDERARAAALPRVLRAVADAASAGDEAAVALGRGALEAGGFEVDYLEIRDAATLGRADPARARRVLAAARLGATRLIDNVAIP